jgi:hypothetical protein
VGDVPEFIEAESNSAPEKAERITLPVTLNGQIAGERDLDYFRFEAVAGDVVNVDVAAARLGSPLDPVVEVYDRPGRRLAVEEIRVGSDPVLAFRVAAAGEYRLLVSNLDFHGGPHYVYRITVSTAPYVQFAFPPGGQAGTAGKVEFVALAGGGPARTWTEEVTFPRTPSTEFAYTPALPTANGVLLEATDIGTTVEAEPNHSYSAATPAPFPATVYGRLSPQSDEDWYAFTAASDQPLTVECRPASSGSGALPVISVCDAAGHPLATASTVEKLPKPCRVECRAPAGGKLLVRVRDVRRGNREQAEAIYRLTIRPTRPDFSLTAAADIINVVQGARAELELKVDRQGGLTEPIDLAVAGLPTGVRVEPAQIPAGQEVVKLAFIAESETRPRDAPLQITGTCRSGDQMVSRVVAAPHLGRDAEGVSLGAPTVEHLQLTVRHKPVFRLFCNEAYQYAYRGTVYPYLMEVERLNGFAGPILLELADRQIKDLDGVEILNSTLPAESSQIMLPLYLPENMHINVQAHSNIYAQGYVVFQDQWGQRQAMSQISEMRCMIRPLPTVAKLQVEEKTLALRPGSSQTCTLHLDRTPNFTGALRVTLAAPQTGLHMEPVVIAAEQNAAVATIVMEDGAAVPEGAQLRFRGEGDLAGGVTLISEAVVPLEPR